MKKILILTAGFGDGHNAAARNLRDAIELLDENARTEVLDLFADSYGVFNTFARKTYLGVVQYAPKLWGGIYSLLDKSPLVEKQLGNFTRLQSTLEKILAEAQPDCVISTYPFTATSFTKFTEASTNGRSGSSRLSPIPSRSIPRGSARRATFSAWPTRPPARCCARAACRKNKSRCSVFP